MMAYKAYKVHPEAGKAADIQVPLVNIPFTY
jgi:hypothetical protein